MRSPSEVLAANVYALRHPRVIRAAREIEARQWWPTERLLAYGDERARALARHAAAHVPYYRELFSRLGLDPERMRIPGDWERLPVLEKAVLKERHDALRADAPWGAHAKDNASGGSTGTPVRFLSDFAIFDTMDAFFTVVQRWAGWKPGELALHFWGGSGRTPESARDRLRARIAGRAILPVFSYDERAFAGWWRVLERLRPTIVHAYPSVLARFAQWLEAEGRRPRGVRGVICSAEILFPAQRAAIERAFGCRVFNQYGSRETPCVACECPLGNMHVFVDLNRVEFLGTPGEAGRFVVTPLTNYAMPLLRYDLDDLGAAEPGPCPCGRGYPLMKLSVGRNRDHLVAADGRRVYAGFVTRLLDPEAWVSSFQFRQTAVDRIVLSVQPAGGAAAAGAVAHGRALGERILPVMREMLGAGLALDVRVVDEIERTGAGKHRYVINEVETDPAGARR